VYSRTGTRKIANTIATQVPALALLGICLVSDYLLFFSSGIIYC